MADEDDFDIDIYGDDKPEFVAEPADEPAIEGKDPIIESNPNKADQPAEPETEPRMDGISGDPPDRGESTSKIPQTSKTHNTSAQVDLPGTAGAAGLASGPASDTTQPQGAKRSAEDTDQDMREIDQGATTSIKLSELQWWTTEDEIRGWANQAGAEDQLREITFNEHKVNGKSKG